MTPPPLTPAIAEAIRATWPKHMRTTYSQTPGFFTHCACQHGITPPCRKGRHDLCQRAEPLRRPEASICDQRGMATFFPEPYQHSSNVSATGPGYTKVAQVWLADRVCRWQCPCDCHTAAWPPVAPIPSAAPVAAAPVQLDIFALIGD